MNPFLQAMQAGYSNNDILNHVSRYFPGMKGMVSKALKSGYTAQQIIEFLSSQGSSANTKGKSQSDILRANSEVDASTAQSAAKTGAALAGSALGAYALNRALGGPMSQAAQGLFGQGGAQPTPPGTPNAAAAAAAQPNIPTIQQADPAIQQEAPAIQQAAMQAPKLAKGQALEIFQNLKLDKQIKNLLDSQPPEIVAKIVEHNFLGKDQLKQLVESTGVPLQELVKAFAEESLPGPQSPQLSPDELIGSNIAAPEPLKQKQDLAQVPLSQNVQSDSTPLPESVQPETEVISEIPSESIPEKKMPEPEENIPVPEEKIPEPENRTEIKTTALPDGRIAKVLTEKNGISKIEVDGEIKHRKTEDLLESNLSLRDLTDLYKKAYESIPKNLRSSNIFWTGYDFDKNELAYIPHAGPLYTFKDIDPDIVTKIKELSVLAKTTGQNAFGAYNKGDPSRGAAMSEIIEELKIREKAKAERKSKETGKEEKAEKPHSGKFEVVFNPLQPLQELMKKDYAAEKKAEKERLNPKPKTKKGKRNVRED